VSDLQNIQSEIVSYWQSNGVLPTKLSDLNDSLGSFTVPSDPQTNQAYEYMIVGGQNIAATSSQSVNVPTSFQLCATFNAQTQPNSPTDTYASVLPSPAGVTGQDLSTDSWFHGAGRACFFRTIDPKRYPPLAKPAATK